jgi:hypothetical protein
MYTFNKFTIVKIENYEVLDFLNFHFIIPSFVSSYFSLKISMIIS